MAPDAYEFGPFRFDVRDRQLSRDGRHVELTPKTALLLLALLEGGGHVVGRDELDSRVWGDANVGLGSLPFQVHLLRRGLGDSGEGQRIVQTVPRLGYRLAVPIQVVDAAVGPAVGAPAEAPVPAATASVAPTSAGGWLRHLGYVAALIAIGALATAAIWPTRPLPRVTGFTVLTRDGRPKAGPLQIAASSVLYRSLDALTLASVPMAGGEPIQQRAAGGDLRLVDFSARRGEYLAIGIVPDDTRFALWVVPASGGPRRRLGQANCQQATWSPDAGQIACTTDDALVVLEHDGTSTRVVARTSVGRPYWPRWSPDGKRLVYSVDMKANRTATSTLWVVDADGTRGRELLAGWHGASSSRCCASWSPDGRYLAYATEEASRRDLWLVRADEDEAPGETPTRLTNGPLHFWAPAWTPDGRRLMALGVARGGEMVRYDPRVRAFVPYLGGLSATWLSFSRDGAWIAYSTFPDGALWRARADGSERQQLTPPMSVVGSSWSPDGARIAFRADSRPGTTRIYVVARDGGPIQPVPAPGPAIGIPSWSPDGRQLATADVPAIFGQPEGTEAVRLYDFATRQWSALPGSSGMWTARWSPDGRYIAALTIRGQQLRLYDTKLRTWRALEADHINNPTWSRGGSHIYYDTEGGALSLRRVSIPDGSVEVLTSLAGFSRAAYWWSGVSPGGDPILLRDVGAVEVYTLDLDGL